MDLLIEVVKTLNNKLIIEFCYIINIFLLLIKNKEYINSGKLID